MHRTIPSYCQMKSSYTAILSLDVQQVVSRHTNRIRRKTQYSPLIQVKACTTVSAERRVLGEESSSTVSAARNEPGLCGVELTVHHTQLTKLAHLVTLEYLHRHYERITQQVTVHVQQQRHLILVQHNCNTDTRSWQQCLADSRL